MPTFINSGSNSITITGLSSTDKSISIPVRNLAAPYEAIKGSYADLGQEMVVNFHKERQYRESTEYSYPSIHINDVTAAASGYVNPHYDLAKGFTIPDIPDVSRYIVEMRFRTNARKSLEINILFEGLRDALSNYNSEEVLAENGLYRFVGPTEYVRAIVSENPYATLIGHLFMLEYEGMEGFREALTSWYFRNTCLEAPEWIKEVSMKELVLYMSSALMREINCETVLLNCFHQGHLPSMHRNSLVLGSFRDLVKAITGSDSPATLRAVWDIFLVGSQYRKVKYAKTDPTLTVNMDSTIAVNYSYGHQVDRLKYQNEEEAMYTGSRRIYLKTLFMAGAVAKAMGLDHMRNFCALLKEKMDTSEKSDPIVSDVDVINDMKGVESIANDLKVMLNFCSPQKVIRGLANGEYHWIRDAVRMYRKYDEPGKVPDVVKSSYPNGIEIPKSWSTFKEFHDKISKAYTDIEEEATNRKIEYFKQAEGLSNLRARNIEVILPRATKELVHWGKHLHICIGSYGDKAVRGDSILLAFRKNGELMYAMELDTNVVKTFVEEGRIVDRYHYSRDDIDDAARYMAAQIERDMFVGDQPVRIEGSSQDEQKKEQDKHPDYLLVINKANVQLRGKRNGSPDPEDKNVILAMLSVWLKRSRMSVLGEQMRAMEFSERYKYAPYDASEKIL